MTEINIEDHWAVWIELKRRLTENHRIDGTRASFAPCLGGHLHGITVPIRENEFEKSGMEWMFKGKAESCKDTYQLRSIQISEEGDTIKVYGCVHRRTMNNSAPRSGDELPYLNTASVEHLLRIFAEEYLEEFDKSL